jgi:hypothetical protein
MLNTTELRKKPVETAGIRQKIYTAIYIRARLCYVTFCI